MEPQVNKEQVNNDNLEYRNNVNRPWGKWIVALFGICIALFLYFHYKGAPPVLPEDTPDEAVEINLGNVIQNMSKVISYEYGIKTTTVIDGKKELVDHIVGTRQNSNRIHFKGRIVDTSVDFYLLDTVIYNKDYMTGKWTQNKTDQLNPQDIFLQELNPIASLAYKEISNSKQVGVEKVNNRKDRIYTCNVVIKHPYMENLWTDFHYKLWLQPDTNLIDKAVVTAVGRSNRNNKLTLELNFAQHNEELPIEPPEI